MRSWCRLWDVDGNDAILMMIVVIMTRILIMVLRMRCWWWVHDDDDGDNKQLRWRIHYDCIIDDDYVAEGDDYDIRWQ